MISMARCTICKKTSDEVELFNGILESEMVNICEECAEDQKVPIIKKPSQSQLNKANKRYSVRERMEIMSGVRDKTEISEDQIVTQGNLARLKAPPKKQTHEDVLDNYYWTLSMARRRKKLTLGYLANKMGVDSSVIRDIEKGILPKDFKVLFMKLESFLGIKLLKREAQKVNFTRRNRDAELEILKSVQNKIKQREELGDEYEESPMEEEEVSVEDEAEEDLDITDKKKLSKITISDLLGRKRRKEAREKKKQEQQEADAMMGDDIDLEIEEL